MKKISFKDISDDIVFFGIEGIPQNWGEGNVYAYMTTPRPKNGFMIIEKGNIVVTDFDGQKRNFSEGALLYIPEGCKYSVNFFVNDDNVCRTLLINFSAKSMTEEKVVFGDRLEAFVSNASTKYSDYFYKIISSFQNFEKSDLRIKADFYGLCAELLSHFQKKELMSTEYSQIAPAIFYMENNINNPATISELARLCTMSETYFRATFKKCMGISPVKFKINLKIQKAKEMLKIHDSILADVSDELGFYDLSYFCKSFKREVGMTPHEYKKSVTE